MAENFAKLLEDSLTQFDITAGKTIQATVIALTSDYVTVSAGLKSESLVPIEEFQNQEGEVEAKVGDIVEVVLAENTDSDGFGTTILSREKAKRAQRWEELRQHHKNGEQVKGVILERVKGGFIVDLDSVQAFLPGSLIDAKNPGELDNLEKQMFEFKIVKMDDKRSNVVVSRRAILDAATQANLAELLNSLEEGQTIKGVVKNLTDYGAFVDLGGIDGLLHITDIAWKRVKHPSDVISEGQQLSVRVLKFDKDTNRVSLGLKQMTEDPWTNITRRYPVGTRLFGKVTNITDYGCFVELEDAVEGLVHMSEMDWTNKNIHPAKIVQVGGEVEVMVLDIDEERRRVSLGIKQCKENPWTTFASTHAINDKIKGTVKSITDFGIFIGLEGNIDGLVHASDVSWDETGEKGTHTYKKGDEVEVVILTIDPERERISLGIKQVDADNIALSKRFSRGTRVQGKILAVGSDKADIEITPEITAHIPLDELEGDFSEGTLVEARIADVNDDTHEILLTTKVQTRASSKPRASHQQKAPQNTTLGDLIKAQMDAQSDENQDT